MQNYDANSVIAGTLVLLAALAAARAVNRVGNSLATGMVALVVVVGMPITLCIFWLFEVGITYILGLGIIGVGAMWFRARAKRGK